MMHIIGFSGPKYSGKSEAANIARECFSQPATYNLPDPIYAACMDIFGWTYEECTDPNLREQVDPRYGVSPRYAQVTLGTDWGRKMINEHLWTIRLEETIRDLRGHSNTDCLVVPNIRFDNEAEVIKSYAGCVFQLNRPGYDHDPQEPSEAGISDDLISAWIYNHDDFQYLRDQVEALVDVYYPHR